MRTVKDSCGCVFCDIGLEPERLGDEMVHFPADSDRWMLCARTVWPTPSPVTVSGKHKPDGESENQR